MQGPDGINWTQATWNPVSGCLHQCSYCYARAFAERFGRSFEPELHPEHLEDPLRRKKATRIFVGSNADLFGAWVPVEWIARTLCTVKRAPQHTFQFLTKNPKRLPNFNPWPRNTWVGASIDIRARLEPTLAALRKVEAPVRFISFEPLNEEMGTPDLTGIEWVIVGAQTGVNAHQPRRAWVERLIAAADKTGAALLMKENLRWQPRREEFQDSKPAQLSLLG